MSKARIMIVEDEVITGMCTRDILENLGYIVTSHEMTGEAAIGRALKDIPDLILMDIRLEGRLDGIETAYEISSKIDIPVVYLTAHSDAEVLERAKATQPFGYMIKPFNSKELQSNIEIALYRHSTEKKLKELKKKLEEEAVLSKKFEEELKNSLNELKMTKQLLETVANGITDEILLITKDFKILWVNDSVLKKRKNVKTEPVGMCCYELTHHRGAPCLLPDTPCPIEEFLRTGKAAAVNHIHYNNSKSSKIYVEVAVYPIINAVGDVDKFIHVSRDVTERMAKEDEIRSLNKALQQKIKEETALRAHERRLLAQQSRLASIGEMIGAIAHQWKQPLTAISLLSQGIKDAYKYGEITKEYMNETVAHIMNKIDFMSKTIHDFRNFLKPTKASTMFDLRDSIEDVLSMFSDMLNTSNIVVTFDKGSPSERFLITGHENEFKHVVLILINNSRDAITACRENNLMSRDIMGEIKIGLSKAGGKIILTVGDNGGGIADDIIGKVFDSYFTTKSEDKGTGIGLYMSKNIIESMGGSITCKNIKGGAEFKIAL
ncbi:MAG: response regulator [Nitrospirae bacterium YQR-1]